MIIDSSQLHNVVRTYHRALNEVAARQSHEATAGCAVQKDGLFLSPEARRHAQQPPWDIKEGQADEP